MRLSMLLTTILAVAAALPARADNLSQIYALAVGQDPVYAAAVQAALAGREKEAQGLAGLRPSLSASAYLRHTDSSVADTDRDYDSHGFALSLTQPLFRKQNLEGYEQSKLFTVQAEQTLRLAGQDLILRVARAYFDLLQAQDNLATVQTEKKAFAEQLAQAKRSFEVGAATIVDSHEAQARYDLSTAREIAALNDLAVRQQTLAKLINREVPPLAPLREDVALVLPDPASQEPWARQAQEGSLAVLTAQTNLDIAQREVNKQRGARLPTLDLAASYSDSRNASFGAAGTGDSKSAVLGLELGWSLYQGGAVSSRIREAVANLEKARFDLDNARRQAALDARQSYLGVLSGEAQSRALQAALVSSESQLKSTTLGLEVGVRTRVDVLNAQQQLSTTRRDLAAARYGAIVNGLVLKAAVGTLGEADLRAVDALLQP